MLNIDRLGTGTHNSPQLVLEFYNYHPQNCVQVAKKLMHVMLARHLVDDTLSIVVKQSMD